VIFFVFFLFVYQSDGEEEMHLYCYTSALTDTTCGRSTGVSSIRTRETRRSAITVLVAVSGTVGTFTARTVCTWWARVYNHASTTHVYTQCFYTRSRRTRYWARTGIWAATDDQPESTQKVQTLRIMITHADISGNPMLRFRSDVSQCIVCHIISMNE